MKQFVKIKTNLSWPAAYDTWRAKYADVVLTAEVIDREGQTMYRILGEAGKDLETVQKFADADLYDDEVYVVTPLDIIKERLK